MTISSSIEKDLYSEMGITLNGRKPTEVTAAEIKSAFQNVSRLLHPDKILQAAELEHLTPEQMAIAVSEADYFMQKMTQAHKELGHVEKRARYNDYYMSPLSKFLKQPNHVPTKYPDSLETLLKWHGLPPMPAKIQSDPDREGFNQTKKVEIPEVIEIPPAFTEEKTKEQPVSEKEKSILEESMVPAESIKPAEIELTEVVKREVKTPQAQEELAIDELLATIDELLKKDAPRFSFGKVATVGGLVGLAGFGAYKLLHREKAQKPEAAAR